MDVLGLSIVYTLSDDFSISIAKFCNISTSWQSIQKSWRDRQICFLYNSEIKADKESTENEVEEVWCVVIIGFVQVIWRFANVGLLKKNVSL